MTETTIYIGKDSRLSCELQESTLHIYDSRRGGGDWRVESEVVFDFGDDRAKHLSEVFAEAARLLAERHERVYGKAPMELSGEDV
jgi:hypothetical protein